MSLAYTGIYTVLIGQLLAFLGVQVADTDITGFITVTTVIVGAVMALYGRHRLGGVSAFGFRK